MYRNEKTGVYVIQNKTNGKRYVGSAAKGFKCRWQQHRVELRKGTHRNRHLQAAWLRDGEASFVFLICEVTLPEHAVAVEQTMIDFYKAADRRYGYNLSPTAGSPLGIKHSPEARANIKAARNTPEARAANSERAKKIYGTPEARAANSARQSTPEAHAALSLAD